jgi:hypothetical protein
MHSECNFANARSICVGSAYCFVTYVMEARGSLKTSDPAALEA